METGGQGEWYVMRDLKRSNAKLPAYKQLAETGFEVFTPMKSTLVRKKGGMERVESPFIPDLLFVNAERRKLDPVVEKTPTLQYRWLRDTYRQPMTIPNAEMMRFIHAVRAMENPKYYRPDEITPAMCGRRVHIAGGTLDGYEGTLLAVRGSKVKRLLVELPNLLCAGVEVSPEYIRLLN